MAADPATLTFIIPLRAKSTCSDWVEISSACRGTIASLLNQDVGTWRCLLVCHEAPVNLQDDERISVIHVDRPVPGDSSEYKGDKRGKLEDGIKRYLENPSTFYMIMDADDRVHISLTKYMSRRTSGTFLIKNGFVYNGGPFVRAHRMTFDRLCGSVCISNAEDAARGIVPHFLGHHLIWKRAPEEGIFINPIPFFAAVKNIAYGGNSTDTFFLRSATVKRTLKKLLMMRPLTRKMKRSFALDTHP